MKERIIVENKAFLNKTDFVCIEDIVKDLKVEYRKEQVPESWEELKELSRKIDISKSADKIEIKLNYNDCLYVYKNGNMCCMNEDSDLSLCYNRTPAQMWNIIKNLIGEE